MYWNMANMICRKWKIWLNRHIWCIEMKAFKSIKNTHVFAEPSHLMYWNSRRASTFTWEPKLNRHIWCIEILSKIRWYLLTYSWTVTFDVLKFGRSLVLTSIAYPLNRHIWCIEMAATLSNKLLQMGWTVTFDVLKSPSCRTSFIMWLNAEPSHLMYWNIHIPKRHMIIPVLNRHIWCIEISFVCFKWLNCFTAEPSHLMYWNCPVASLPGRLSPAEPSHLMYWNPSCPRSTCFLPIAEPSHLMYWNLE